MILLTDRGLSLGFPVSEVSEFKKTSRGVKAIALEGEDLVAYAAAVEQTAETFCFKGRTLNARRVRSRHRAARGHKASLDVQ